MACKVRVDLYIGSPVYAYMYIVPYPFMALPADQVNHVAMAVHQIDREGLDPIYISTYTQCICR